MPYSSESDVPKNLKHLGLGGANRFASTYDALRKKGKPKASAAAIAMAQQIRNHTENEE